jgi:hypothetical protein
MTINIIDIHVNTSQKSSPPKNVNLDLNNNIDRWVRAKEDMYAVSHEFHDHPRGRYRGNFLFWKCG